MSVAAPLLHAVVWKEGCLPTARVCVPHPADFPTLHPVRVDAHIWVLIFLKAHGCPLLPLLFFFFSPPHHVEERESKAEGSRAARQSRAGGQASSEMAITNLAVRWHAMCCWMLMQGTRSTTLVHLLPPPPPLHLLITAFPFPLSLTMRHTAAPHRSR